MLTIVRRIALTTAVGLTVALAASPATAQEDPDYPVEVAQPTLAAATSVCDGGTAGVEVILDDRTKPYTVTLAGSGLPAKKTAYDDEHGVNRVLFTPVPVGEYTVGIKGADEPSDGLPVVVKPCADRDPAKGALSVDVQCRGGWGLATFEIANPGTDEVRDYRLQLGTPDQYQVQVAPGMFLSITENLYDDGVYRAVLTGGGLDEPLARTFTVNCAAGNSPGLGTYAQCDDKADVTTPAVLWVEIDNPNRAAVEYTVSASGASRAVTVSGAGHGSVDLGPVPAGDHQVVVRGSDGTETETGVAVDYCADVVVDRDGLQVSTRCVAGKSVVTFRYYAVGPFPAVRNFSVKGAARYDEEIRFDGPGVYQWTRYAGRFKDGTYTAQLVGGGLRTTEKFTVDC
ncbi:hypothetical protein [Actinokineospora enzanensis]|uniref:hypothetical protein n=1 Tax=Actinokineospora enzanensis TaxID=155975 RepID=UPI00037ED4BE|nr:hypothetical protein [Actinokineospora enzanensis]